MNKNITLIVLLLISFQEALAYIPTLDSLLRNGNNIDIENQTIVANVNIKKINETESELENPIPETSSLKFILPSDVDGLNNFIQIDYRDGNFSPATINSLLTKNSFNSNSLVEANQETHLFYGLLKSLLINKSDLLISTLKNIDPLISENKDNIDLEQKDLLRKYKKYLTDVNEEKENLDNPLKSESVEETKKIKEILKKSFLKDSPIVKRIFKDKKFYYYYKSEKIEALFDNETHQLTSLSVLNEKGKTQIRLMNYVLFSKGFEFPEVVSIKTPEGQSYEVMLKKISIIKDTKETFYARLSRYKKQLSKAQDQVVNLIKPYFLM